jgi:fermentation-respiration switch protein FrsA (DUF1100 family)
MRFLNRIKALLGRRPSAAGSIAAGIGIAGALAAAAAVLSRLFIKTLVGEALDRDQPRAVKAVTDMLIDAYSEKEPYKTAVEKGRELENMGLQTVSVTAEDGIKLTGHWYPAADPARVVLAVHGWRSSWWKDFGAVSDFLHDSRCSVMFIEQRGQGNSEGEYMGFGMTERFDMLVWLDWLCGHTRDLPIYITGISMGATTVLMTSGLGLPERVHGIIADCGFTSAKEIFRYVARNRLHLMYDIHKADIEYFCKEKIQVGTDDYSTIDALRVNTVPVLFVHGTDDTFVPISMTYENYKACAAPKMLFVVPGAEHGGSYLIDSEGYEEKLCEFWARYDGSGPYAPGPAIR